MKPVNDPGNSDPSLRPRPQPAPGGVPPPPPTDGVAPDPPSPTRGGGGIQGGDQGVTNDPGAFPGDPIPFPVDDPGVINGDPGPIPVEEGGCFSPGTLVAMSSATHQAIEDVKIGDLVLTRQERTGKMRLRPVLRTWMHERKPTVVLHFENGECIHTTLVHRVFAAAKGLVAVSELEIGDRVDTLARGPLEIVHIQPGPETAVVYNLTVADFHTYFVGDAGMWVHNDKNTDQGQFGTA